MREYPGANLSHVESNRGVADNRHGRFYLRYALKAKAPVEFFAYVSSHPTVDLKKGVVGVVVSPSSPV